MEFENSLLWREFLRCGAVGLTSTKLGKGLGARAEPWLISTATKGCLSYYHGRNIINTEVRHNGD